MAVAPDDFVTCLVTGRSLPVREMVRFVLDPQRRVMADIAAQLPGNAWYITAERPYVEQAVAEQLFGADASVDAALPDRVERALEQRALQLLAMAKKAGVLIVGYDKALERLLQGKGAVLLHAEDAAPDGCQRLDSAAKQVFVAYIFSRDALSLALGELNAVHVLIQKGAMAGRIKEDIYRLCMYKNTKSERR